MSFLDIALMVSIPLGTIALTLTYKFRKKQRKKRASLRQRTLL